MKRVLHYNLLKYCLFLFVFIIVACRNTTKDSQIDKSQTSMASTNMIANFLKSPYNLDQPIVCELPKKLVEISALTINRSSNIIYSINDEKGIIYSIEDCNVTNEFHFGKKGDYEGIELVDDFLYVLKSNGKLIKQNIDFVDKGVEIKTDLRISNDTEGLGFDSKENILLIACKESANIKDSKKIKKAKAVYAYDIKTDSFIEEPVLLIKDKDIENYFLKFHKEKLSNKEAKRKLQRALKFSPSAIAINPIDGNYYLLSSIGKTLMILNKENEIVHLNYLDYPEFTQPEGICFNSKGDMLISNEGKNSKGNILTFINKN